jgi:hypothetical protein
MKAQQLVTAPAEVTGQEEAALVGELKMQSRRNKRLRLSKPSKRGLAGRSRFTAWLNRHESSFSEPEEAVPITSWPHKFSIASPNAIPPINPAGAAQPSVSSSVGRVPVQRVVVQAKLLTANR